MFDDEDVVARVAAMFERKPGSWQPREARHQQTHLVRSTGAARKPSPGCWLCAL